MAKRTLEEGVAAMPASNGFGNDVASAKKRKVQDSDTAGANGVVGAPLKAERKEHKRLKKLQKESQKEGFNENLKPERTTSAEDAVEKATKAAKKAEKKRLKASNAADAAPVIPKAKVEREIAEALLTTKAISKADLKAERLRMKELRAETAVPNHSTEQVHVRQPKSERKAEKKRLKVLHEAEKAGTNGDKSVIGKAGKEVRISATNGHSNGTLEPSSYTEDRSLQQVPQSNVDKYLSSNFIQVTDPKTSNPMRPIMEFSQLPENAHPSPSPFKGFKTPTPIQATSWPFLLAGRDVIGVAETGSGKTLAFGVPCIRYIASLPRVKGGAARAVIVSPTRELAVQIYEQITKLAKPAGLEAVCVYGGVPKEAQRFDLKTAQIVVATPGRLNDLIQEGYADLGNVGYVVLDEADRMLDKGFEDAIRQIISATSPGSSQPSNPGRQTLMFTATWPPSIRELASTFMRTPVKITIGDNPTGELRANNRITQTVEVVDPRSKEMRLLQLLKQHQSGASREDRILVFCLYKKEATRVEGYLRQKGMRVAAIHGDLSQEKRAASLEGFKKGTTPLLVATDVAARGLDIPAVKVVINVTFPLTVEDYVHRIGRTGRAGADGLAITLFTEHDKAQSGSLINVLKAAGQPVPDELLKFGTTVKKKGHEAYGAFYKDTGDVVKEATKIKFDD